MAFDVTFDSSVPDELLDELAKELVSNPTNKEQIALRVCGGDFALMQRVLEATTHITFTQRMMQLQRNMNDSDRLRSKEKFALEVQDKMSGFNGELWLKTAQFYAKLMGFVEEKVQTNTVQNVIVVPAGSPDMDVWSSDAAAYARKLQNEAKIIDAD